MSKYGVGIGDDFPLDDGRGPGAAGPNGAPRDDRAEFEDWKRRRDEWRAQREAWKAQAENWRRQRDEWRARRRAYRDQHRADYYGGRSDLHYGRGWYPQFFGFGLFRLLAFFAVIALIVFAFSHLYVVIGILAVVALFAASHRHGFDPFDFGPRDYAPPPPPSTTATTQPPATPPATTPQDPAA